MATCPRCQKSYPAGVDVCAADGERLLPDSVAANFAEADLAPGQQIGEYIVEAKIGEGGFGSVYRGIHPLIGKAAAIKVLNRQYSSNPQMVSRFISEARAVNQIKNRHIIDIFSFGALPDGRQYYVMDLLDGMPLDQYLAQRGRLAVEDALPLFRGVAKAIDAAHGAGIAHRDLKPENVFVVIESDGTTFPKLLDFGIAKLLGESMAGHKTRTGSPIGTPHYMSPEQCRGKNVDHRTDIYSFGCLVHQTLTGLLPFDGDDVMEVLFKQTSAPAPPMSSVCPQVPTILDAPVLQMLEKDPAKRPATLGAAVDALASAARNAGMTVAPTSGETTSMPRHVTGGAITGGGGSTAASITGGGAVSAKLTPGEISAISGARTVLDAGATRTLTGASSEVAGGGRSRAPLYAIVALACVAGVAAGVVLVRPRATATSDGAASATPRAGASAPANAGAGADGSAHPDGQKPLPSASASPIVAPSTAAPSATAAAPPAELDLRLEANAPHVDVLEAGKKIGEAPGSIKISGAAPHKLTFRAPGYATLEREVSTSESSPLKIELIKAKGAAPGAKHINKDLDF